MNTDSLYPENFARFYDTVYHHHRDGVDNTFYLDKMKEVNGPVLEVGVGTGRFFMDALHQNTDIWGLDISTAMTEVLLKKLDKNHHFRISNQNIIDFTYDFKFDLILAPFRVFMHLNKKEDQLRALNNVYDHLTNNGRFIFDAFVPDLNQLIQGTDNFKDFEGEYAKGKKIRRIVTNKSDLINQLIYIHFRLEWEQEKDNTTGENIESDDWYVSLRYFFRYELEHLVERSRFEKYRILGDFMGNDLNEESKEFIVVCKKNL